MSCCDLTGGKPDGRQSTATAIAACALVLLLVDPCDAVGQAQAPAVTQPQSQIVEDLLSGDRGWREAGFNAARSLGRSRMSDEVHDALIAFLEQVNDEQAIALAQGIALENVINGELYCEVARYVSFLNDPRAIPALAESGRYCFSRIVVRRLAAFGEQALPAILGNHRRPRGIQLCPHECLACTCHSG